MINEATIQIILSPCIRIPDSRANPNVKHSHWGFYTLTTPTNRRRAGTARAGC